MRNLILLSAILILGVTALNANTNPNTSVLFASATEKSVVLNVAGLDIEQINILDKKGNVILEDVIEENKNKIKYDLASLPVDMYTIKVIGNDFIEFYNATVSSQSVVLSNTTSYYRPSVKSVAGKVEVKLNQATNDDVRVTIFDEANELVYVYSENVEGAFAKTFNLEQLTSGKYSVIVSTDYFSDQVDISL